LKERLVWPGLLSIAATAAPFSLVWYFLTAHYSIGEGVGPGFGELILVLVFGGLGMLLLAFSIVLLLDKAHHMIWAAIVSIFYGLTCIFLIPYLLSTLAFSTNPILDPFWAEAGATLLLLGLAGGVWSFFWKTSLTPHSVGHVVMGPVGRTLIGGLVGLISLLSLTLGFAGMLSALGAVLVLVRGLIVYRDPTTSRALGVVVVVGSLIFASLPASEITSNLMRGAGFYPAQLPISLGGALLALTGGIGIYHLAVRSGKQAISRAI
jgi:hypothetical protein